MKDDNDNNTYNNSDNNSDDNTYNNSDDNDNNTYNNSDNNSDDNTDNNSDDNDNNTYNNSDDNTNDNTNDNNTNTNDTISASKEANLIYPYLYNRWDIKENTTNNAKIRGLLLHKEINKYLKGEKLTIKNGYINSFNNFIKSNNLKLIETEKRLTYGKYIGCIDAIFKRNSKIILIDWKFCYDINLIGYNYDKYFGLPISNYNKYCYQLHIYYYLAINNGYKIDELLIVNFRNDGNYFEYSVKFNANWINYIEHGILTKYEIQEFKLLYGEYKDKVLSEIPIEYLKYLCCFTIINGNIIDVLNYYTINNITDINSEILYLYENNKDIINNSRMYIDNLKICLNCLKTKAKTTFCKTCRELFKKK